MKNGLKNLLVVVFFIVYILAIKYFIWPFLPISTGAGVFGVSMYAIAFSLMFAFLTANKISETMQN